MKPKRTRKQTALVSKSEAKFMTEWLKKREGGVLNEFQAQRRKK